MIIVGYLLTGLAIGAISGMLGIGGGVLLIPVLMWFFHFDQPTATGTTLAVLVPPVGILAALKYYQLGFLNIQAAMYIAIAFVAGAYLGALAMPLIPRDILRVLFGLLLFYIGGLVIFSDEDTRSAAIGLVVVGLGLAAFALKGLGRRYRPRTLAETITSLQTPEHTEPDYHI